MQRSAYIIVKVLIILFTGKVSCHKQKRGRRKRAHTNQGASERQGAHMCSGNGGSGKLSGNGSSRKRSRRAATDSSRKCSRRAATDSSSSTSIGCGATTAAAEAASAAR